LLLISERTQQSAYRFIGNQFLDEGIEIEIEIRILGFVPGDDAGRDRLDPFQLALLIPICEDILCRENLLWSLISFQPTAHVFLYTDILARQSNTHNTHVYTHKKKWKKRKRGKEEGEEDQTITQRVMILILTRMRGERRQVR
jgi:hypothetical protein